MHVCVDGYVHLFSSLDNTKMFAEDHLDRSLDSCVMYTYIFIREMNIYIPTPGQRTARRYKEKHTRGSFKESVCMLAWIWRGEMKIGMRI